MKKLFMLLLVLALSVPCFAGALLPPDEYVPDEIYVPIEKVIERIIEKPIIQQVEKKINKSYGYTLGFSSDYLLAGYCDKNIFIEAGLKDDTANNLTALVKGGGILLSWPDKNSSVRIGLVVNPGVITGPTFAPFIGVEKDIDNRVAIGVDAYAWLGNNCYTLPAISVFGKIIL